MHASLDQLTRPRVQGDRASLLAVMRTVRAVRRRMPAMAAALEPLRDGVALLQAHHVPVELPPLESPGGPEDALDFVANAALLWDEVLGACFRAKEDVLAEQRAAVGGVRQELAQFGHRCYAFGRRVKKAAPFKYRFHASPEAAALEDSAGQPAPALWVNAHAAAAASGQDEQRAEHGKAFLAAANAAAAGARSHEQRGSGAAGDSAKGAREWCRGAYLALAQLEAELRLLEGDAEDLQELGDLFEIDTNVLAQP
jgi:hypothetical protein